VSRDGITADAAFASLIRGSEGNNQRLRALADAVVATVAGREDVPREIKDALEDLLRHGEAPGSWPRHVHRHERAEVCPSRIK
jgi:hypothetical protein